MNWKGASRWRGKKDEVSGRIENECIESKRINTKKNAGKKCNWVDTIHNEI